MAQMIPGLCQECGEALPEGSHFNLKFCSACKADRKAAQRRGWKTPRFCQWCEADISHRGPLARQCEQCAKVRLEWNAQALVDTDQHEQPDWVSYTCRSCHRWFAQRADVFDHRSIIDPDRACGGLIDLVITVERQEKTYRRFLMMEGVR